MSNEQAAPETKDVAVKLLSTVDLGRGTSPAVEISVDIVRQA
jgi:hypothetical protein